MWRYTAAPRTSAPSCGPCWRPKWSTTTLQPATEDAGFQALLALAGTGRVWVKLAAAYRSWPRQDAEDVSAAAALLRQHFGNTRLLWGSDWPHTQHQHLSDFGASQAVLAQWLPDAADREAACIHTPAALFRCG